MRPEDEDKILKLVRFVADNYPRLPYHNAQHSLEVWNAARQYAIIAEVPYKDKLVLEPAALLHDVVFVPGKKDNEEKSARFAIHYLPVLGYSSEQAYRAGKLILATKMPQKPENFLEQLLCDSDLDNLGRKDFIERGEKLRQELGLPEGTDWYKQQLEFLQSHKYHTDVVRSLRYKGKQRNIRRLKRKLRAPELEVK